MKNFCEILNIYNSLTKQTKAILILGGVYIMLILTACASCRICAGTLISYYTAMELSSAFLTSANSCIGITGISALIMEAVSR